MQPKREVPYSIDFACFKKYLDRVAVVMVNSPMLARHLDHPPRRKSFPCILLQPLCALFSSAALSFQSLAASFPKTPGWGYLRAASAPAAPARPAGGSRRYHLPLLLSPISSRLSPLSGRSSMLFRINTCKSVSKQTTLTSFRINTYEKRGGGGTYPRQTEHFPLLRAGLLRVAFFQEGAFLQFGEGFAELLLRVHDDGPV